MWPVAVVVISPRDHHCIPGCCGAAPPVGQRCCPSVGISRFDAAVPLLLLRDGVTHIYAPIIDRCWSVVVATSPPPCGVSLTLHPMRPYPPMRSDLSGFDPTWLNLGRIGWDGIPPSVRPRPHRAGGPAYLRADARTFPGAPAPPWGSAWAPPPPARWAATSRARSGAGMGTHRAWGKAGHYSSSARSLTKWITGSSSPADGPHGAPASGCPLLVDVSAASGHDYSTPSDGLTPAANRRSGSVLSRRAKEYQIFCETACQQGFWPKCGDR